MESEDYLSLWEDDRVPCHICNRKFNPSSLEKHTNVCEKTLSKKRKPFDSTKQRIQGTELAEFLPAVNVTPQKPKIVKQAFLKGNSRWKENHIKLIKIIEAARGTQAPESASKSTKSNCEQCPYCDRSFGPKSFDRHIEWCKEQVYRINQMSPAVLEAKERLEARTKYRAPSIRSRRCAIRDKYCPKGRSKDDHYDLSQSTINSKKTAVIIKPSLGIPKSEFKIPERSEIKTKHPETNFIRQNVLRCSYKKGTPNKSQTGKDQGKLLNDKGDEEDHMTATCIRIKPGQQNIRTKSNKPSASTPVKSAKEVYDLYASAEQQMQKLLVTEKGNGSILNDKESDCDILSRSYTVSPEKDNEKENETIDNGWDDTPKNIFNQTDTNDSVQKFSTSPSSAFSKYIPENEIIVRTPTPVPTYSDDEYFTKDINRYPLINLSNLSLCSTVSIDVLNDSKRNYTDSRKLNAKRNLRMEHMLYGNDEDKGKISPESSQVDLHEEFYKSVSEFKEMLEKTKEDCDFSSNTSSASSPTRSDLQNRTEADGNEISCGEENDHSLSLNSKISIDSAYSSLNRKSPIMKSKMNRSVSEMSDFRAISSTPSMETHQKMSKYCHECGAKYPLSVAKFCCECGIRRLVL